MTFARTENGTVKMTDGKIFLSQEEKVVKADTLNALHYVQYNLSYSSATQQSALLKITFSDSSIAQAFTSASAKMAYIIKYGLGKYFKDTLKEDLHHVPFTFNFDESTTTHVKKQYDAYACYWSNLHNCLVNNCVGSVFIGHCTSSDLVDHYLEFKRRLDFNDHMLLHLEMDGPNVSLVFEPKLMVHMQESSSAGFLQLGTC